MSRANAASCAVGYHVDSSVVVVVVVVGTALLSKTIAAAVAAALFTRFRALCEVLL